MDYMTDLLKKKKKNILRQLVKKFHICSEIKISNSSQEKLATGSKFTQLNPITSYCHAIPPEVLSPLFSIGSIILSMSVTSSAFI
jgi:hypothetical protein